MSWFSPCGPTKAGILRDKKLTMREVRKSTPNNTNFNGIKRQAYALKIGSIKDTVQYLSSKMS